MRDVRAKKHLGQHFLIDDSVTERIALAFKQEFPKGTMLEVGPGMGVLTEQFIDDENYDLIVSEIDSESVAYLKGELKLKDKQIIEGDFLKLDLPSLLPPVTGLIGNFPYNISSQIFFKVLDHIDMFPVTVGMLQKEVAERLCSPPGNKKYGILSVLLQAYFDMEYLFTVPPEAFNPPPKVESGVMRMVRNNVVKLDCDEKLFKQVIKMGFNSRRKTLRNALKSLALPIELTSTCEYFNKRAEQLGVEEFIELTNLVDNAIRD
jgi:16S rRNA (adenine1518-N6/adenine1519-N6)-dimethyltransferase